MRLSFRKEATYRYWSIASSVATMKLCSLQIWCSLVHLL